MCKTNRKKCKLCLRLLCWVGALVWAGLIFYMSSKDATASSGLSGSLIHTLLKTFWPPFRNSDPETQLAVIASLQFLVRKTAHFCIYGSLGLWVLGALSTYTLSFRWREGLTLGLVLLYAASDEIHQYFIPGRSSQWQDVLLDVSGALAFTLAAHLLSRALLRIRRREKSS